MPAPRKPAHTKRTNYLERIRPIVLLIAQIAARPVITIRPIAKTGAVSTDTKAISVKNVA